MAEAVYNTIGKTYDTTRKADPGILNKLLELLQYQAGKRYLDIGCGSGNYTGALAAKGLQIEGIDISDEMLTKARQKYPQVVFHEGSAMQTPFQANAFDGAICIFATHHIGNNAKLFPEAFRIMKAGHFVIFTATPEQVAGYWLNHYFPIMLENDQRKLRSFASLKLDLENSGFRNVQQIPFYVTNELQDWFFSAGKYRPEIYLDPLVRQGISSFHLSIDKEELDAGLKQLRADIDSGKIKEIIGKYESNLGECSFVVAEKI